jgi:recombination protein RecA
MAKKEKEKKDTTEVSSDIDPILRGILGKDYAGVIGFGAAIEKREGISTGSLGLDLKLGGYLARDRLIEFFGPPGSFKTSMSLIAMLGYVKKHGYKRSPFIIDMERTIDRAFITSFGLDPDQIIIARPRTAEEALDVTEKLLTSTKCGFGIFDSVDACETEKEMERSLSEMGMAELPRLMSRFSRSVSKITADADCGLIMINQIRATMDKYKPEVTSGGNGLPYYACQRIRFSSKKSAIVEGAAHITARIKKNKLFPTIEAETEFDLIPAQGIVKLDDWISTGKQIGVLSTAGAYIDIMDGDETLTRVHGRDGLKEWLETNKNQTLFDSLIRSRFMAVSGTMVTNPSEAEENSLDVQ